MKPKIAVLPGDGIGPEVTKAALRVLEACLPFEAREGLVGGAAIDATGEALPAETVALCRESDVVFLGAVGGPKWEAASVRPEQGLLGLRRALGVYANLRPARCMGLPTPLKDDLARQANLLVVRDLAGVVYFGEPRGTTATEAINTWRQTVEQTKQVALVAFQQARKRRKRVTSVDKANVLEASRLWRAVVVDVAHRPSWPGSWMHRPHCRPNTNRKRWWCRPPSLCRRPLSGNVSPSRSATCLPYQCPPRRSRLRQKYPFSRCLPTLSPPRCCRPSRRRGGGRQHLVRRLREAFGRGGLLHFGQGKWYPGEPLPRWAYGCFWRKDGLAVWRDPELLADVDKDYGMTHEHAERFARQLAQRLGIDPQRLVPGYEDTFWAAEAVTRIMIPEALGYPV